MADILPAWYLDIRREYGKLIDKNCDAHTLNPKLVASIIQVESAGNTFAIRYEPGWTYHYRSREIAAGLRITADTEYHTQMISFGLMQIMGTVARELGFMGNLPELCVPSVGILYGCRKLAEIRARFQCGQEDMVSAYNQGSPRKNKGGQFKNFRYVDKVYTHYRQLTKLS